MTERLSPKEFLSETCPACNGSGFMSGPVRPVGCSECRSTGRVVRFTHSPASDVTTDAADVELERLRAEVARLERHLDAKEETKDILKRDLFKAQHERDEERERRVRLTSELINADRRLADAKRARDEYKARHEASEETANALAAKLAEVEQRAENLRASHDYPRLGDVAKIDALDARLAEYQREVERREEYIRGADSDLAALREEQKTLLELVRNQELLLSAGRCSYCGHLDIQEELPKHIQTCPKHPLATARALLEEARAVLTEDEKGPPYTSTRGLLNKLDVFLAPAPPAAPAGKLESWCQWCAGWPCACPAPDVGPASSPEALREFWDSLKPTPFTPAKECAPTPLAPPEPEAKLSRTHVRGPGNLGFATCGRRYPDARFVEAGPSCKVCRHILEKREARHG